MNPELEPRNLAEEEWQESSARIHGLKTILREAQEDCRENFQGDIFRFQEEKSAEELSKIKEAADKWLSEYPGQDPHIENIARFFSGLEAEQEEEKAA